MPFLRYAPVALGLIALRYLVVFALKLPVAYVALVGSVGLLYGAWRFKRLRWRRLGKDILWSLFGFIAGLFLIVRAVERLGVLAPISQAFVRGAGSDSFLSVLAVAAGAAVGSNAINNIPMTLVLVATLHGAHQAVMAHLPCPTPPFSA